MKKWIGMFIAVSFIVLLVVRSVFGEDISEKADFGRICDEGEYYSQIARCDDKYYVVYRTQENKVSWVENIDKNLYRYEALGTVHPDRIYYLYSFYEDGRLNFSAEPLESMELEEPVESGVWLPPLLEAEGTFFAAGSTEDEILISIMEPDKRTITEYALPLYYEEMSEWEERVSFSILEGHYAVGGIYEEGELYLIQEDGAVLLQDIAVEEIGVTVDDTTIMNSLKKGIITGAEGEWLTVVRNYASVKYFPLILMISLFIVFLFYGIRNENHLIYRLICYTQIIIMLALSVVGYFFEDSLMKQEILENGTKAGYVLEELKLKQQADGTVEAESYLSTLRSREDILEDLIIADSQSGEVLQAKTLPAGLNIYDYYGEECKALVEQLADGNQSVMMYLKESGSDNYIVSSKSWTDIEAWAVLLAVIPRAGIENHVGNVISSVWSTIYIIMLFVTVLNMIAFLLFSSIWKRFLAGMQYVAMHKKPYMEIPERNDGLYSAWSILERIGHNTIKLQHDREVSYKNYYRFVPKGMEQLLHKPKTAEIEIGDHRKVRGCMVHFQMEDMKEKEDAVYGKMMTESMEIMHKFRKRYEGIFISANADLLERKLFFEQSPASALNFAIETYCGHNQKEMQNEECISMLLHHTDYNYGISGTEDIITPYIYCSEENILKSCQRMLAKAKVKIALTEQVVNELGNKFSVRYIGYVSDEKTQEKIRLYECMDIYQEEKRKIMEDSDSMLQKALNLFYVGEFYQAENWFNEVLKMNEQDEIARWYFFRCTEFLDGKEDEISYELFEK